MLVSGLSVPKWRRTFLVLLGLSAFVTLILHSKSGNCVYEYVFIVYLVTVRL